MFLNRRQLEKFSMDMEDPSMMVGRTSDKGVLLNMDKALGRHDHFRSRQTDKEAKHLERERHFEIKHFAGNVVYAIDGFLEKNKDTLFQDLKRALFKSTNQIISGMWPEGGLDAGAVTRRPPTAGKMFKKSMGELVAQLEAKEPFYVRCIKPNEEKSATKFEDTRCRHQVRYLGLMENVRVRKAGYATRMPFEHFVARQLHRDRSRRLSTGRRR